MSKKDVFEEVTNKIIELLDEVNFGDYEAPFAELATQGLPLNPTTDHYYQGGNILALWIMQQAKKFTSNQWATYKQWQDFGAQVREGEKGSKITFYKTLTKDKENYQGAKEETKIPMLKLFTVFNANQVNGYEHREVEPINSIDLVKRIAFVDDFCTATKAETRHGEKGGAFYHRLKDYIHMPDTIDFLETSKASATENYYATLLHELTHWTGAKHRLNRDKAKTNLETEKLAFEELIAELGAAFLCAQMGIAQTSRKDHAIYIKGWLTALKNDKKFIFKASAQAAKAVDYLNSLQTTQV